MSLLNVEKQWRGPSLKLIITVTRFKDNKKEVTTEVMDIDGLAEIYGKLQSANEPDLNLRIGMRRSEAAKDFTVTANIRLNNFNKHFPCPDEWVEVAIKPDISNKGSVIRQNPSVTVYSYTVVLEIIVKATKPASSLVNKLLYEDNEFTDFQLHSADGTVAVHKAFLAVHGDMFKTMLRGEWKETEQGSININGVSVQTLQHLKEYMYLGTLPDEGLEDLLLISTPYLMENLETACITKLIKTLKPENFDGLIKFACQNNITKLVKALVLRIPDNIVNGIHQLQLEQEVQESGDEK